jgi:hypothetical protein
MISTPRTLLAALLLAGAFAAGCGGDDNDDSGSDAPVVTAESPGETPTVDDTTLTTDTIPEDVGGAEVPENLEAAIQQCKDGVEATTALEDSVKEDLIELCEDAATRSPEELADIARETCEKVVEGTLPAGDARDQALKSCETAGD